jgi:two-component system response regulator AtoC
MIFPMVRVLFIDDNPKDQDTMAMVLERHYTLIPALDGAEGLRLLAEREPDVVLLDIELPDRDGLELLEEILARPEAPPVIMLTGHGDVQFVKRAIQAGAYDYILKPWHNAELEGTLRQAVLYADLGRAAGPAAAGEALAELIGESRAMRDLKSLILRYAAVDAPVLIQGESGCGKELTAAALHRLSPRRAGPFIAVNCGAIPASLLETELFGAERGAYTDALSRPGCFERANHGSIFLDEIGELAREAQVKLLRVLESKELLRVGGTEPVRLDLRVISATNKDLKREMEQERFREDLYYRVHVLPLKVPALRERPEDIPLLASCLLGRHGRATAVLQPDALSKLCSYSWPGNIRELGNVLERARVTADDGRIRARDIVL